MKWYLKFGLYAILISGFIQSCKLDKKEKGEKLLIVCTTGMISDVVQNIVKDSCFVKTLMGPGVDPHLYKPSPKDIQLLQQADVIVHNGLHLEGKMTDVFDKMKKEKTIITWSDGVAETKLINNTEFQGNFDPHIWFDSELFMNGAEYFKDKLSEVDETNASYYKGNLESYKSELTKNEELINESLKSIKEENRILITSHDAFSYFGRKYNFKVRGLQGISTISEFGINDKVSLVNFIIDNKVKVLFVESSVSSKSLESVISSCESSGHSVRIGGMLLSDAMDAKDKLGGNYIGMLRYNMNTIINGINGK